MDKVDDIHTRLEMAIHERNAARLMLVVKEAERATLRKHITAIRTKLEKRGNDTYSCRLLVKDMLPFIDHIPWVFIPKSEEQLFEAWWEKEGKKIAYNEGLKDQFKQTWLAARNV